MYDLLSDIESRTTALTLEDVAVLFKSSPETVRRGCVSKKLPGFKFMGEWRFNPSSLGYWLRQRDPLAAKASRVLKQNLL
jgi:hypothetical protein